MGSGIFAEHGHEVNQEFLMSPSRSLMGLKKSIISIGWGVVARFHVIRLSSEYLWDVVCLCSYLDIIDKAENHRRLR